MGTGTACAGASGSTPPFALGPSANAADLRKRPVRPALVGVGGSVQTVAFGGSHTQLRLPAAPCASTTARQSHAPPRSKRLRRRPSRFLDAGGRVRLDGHFFTEALLLRVDENVDRHHGTMLARRTSSSIRPQNSGEGFRLPDSHWYTTALPAAPICSANSVCVSRRFRRKRSSWRAQSDGTRGQSGSVGLGANREYDCR
jgi:hypothetical protein